MPVLPAVPSTMIPPGLRVAAPDGVLDDEEGRPVLHGLAGIHELRLAQDGAARRLRSAAKLDERRVADRGEDVWLDGHGIEL